MNQPIFYKQWASARGGNAHTAQPPRQPRCLARLLRASRARFPRREHLLEQVPLPCLPELDGKAMDNHFMCWPVPVWHLHGRSILLVLSSWWSQITPHPDAQVEVALTNLPFTVRLLSFGENPKE